MNDRSPPGTKSKAIEDGTYRTFNANAVSVDSRPRAGNLDARAWGRQRRTGTQAGTLVLAAPLNLTSSDFKFKFQGETKKKGRQKNCRQPEPEVARAAGHGQPNRRRGHGARAWLWLGLPVLAA